MRRICSERGMGALNASNAMGWCSLVRMETARDMAVRVPVTVSAVMSSRRAPAGIRSAGASKSREAVPVASAKASAVNCAYQSRVAVSSSEPRSQAPHISVSSMGSAQP